jgi:uncharacterized protein (DUF1697 family)
VVASTRYLALLRGINVGGRNRVAMRDLRAAVEQAGYEQVSTYIQSGNVMLAAPAGSSNREIEPALEAALEASLGLPLVVVVRSLPQLRAVVQHAPEGFGAAPETFHSDAVFLKQPLTSEDAMRVVRLREGVDQAWPGEGVLYFQRLSARRTQSRMSAIIGAPEYRLMTIRSWATTTTLLTLLQDPAHTLT